MSELKYTQFEKISLKNNPSLNESWIQKIIADNPSILGLGDLVLRDKERIQPKAGRLDLLLQEANSDQRYEVEVQLGSVDEAHIIRTIEYWDIERRRYPQYDHTAVIIAEDVTSRFLNVLSLFNGFIPIVALQMKALKHNEHISLVFTKIIDQMVVGTDEEDIPEPTDRSYWEKKGSKTTIKMLDNLFEDMRQFAENIEPKYNKYYVGISVNGIVNNFTTFKTRKRNLNISIRMDKEDEMVQQFEEAGLEVTAYSRWGKYELRLSEEELNSNRELILTAIKQAHQRSLN
jgi:hypothetical protein